MAKYRLKTELVNAVKWEGNTMSLEAVFGLLPDEHKDLIQYKDGVLLLKTWEGVVKVDVGNYVVEETYQPGMFVSRCGIKFEEDHELVEETDDDNK